MKIADIEIGKEYRTRINGRFCRVKVTGRRVIDPSSPGNWIGRKRSQTVFDWVRVNPPPGATKLKGSDTAASLHPITDALRAALPPEPMSSYEAADSFDASGGEPEPSPGGEPVPERGDLPRVHRVEVSDLPLGLDAEIGCGKPLPAGGYCNRLALHDGDCSYTPRDPAKPLHISPDMCQCSEPSHGFGGGFYRCRVCGKPIPHPAGGRFA